MQGSQFSAFEVAGHHQRVERQHTVRLAQVHAPKLRSAVRFPCGSFPSKQGLRFLRRCTRQARCRSNGTVRSSRAPSGHLRHKRLHRPQRSATFQPTPCCIVRGLTLQSRGQTTACRTCALLLVPCRRCLPLISNVRPSARPQMEWLSLVFAGTLAALGVESIAPVVSTCIWPGCALRLWPAPRLVAPLHVWRCAT